MPCKRDSYKKLAFSLIELSLVILVIGILIAGILLSNKMLGKMKLASAINQTLNSPVPTISGLILWLEPTMDDSFTSSNPAHSAPVDGDTISQWNDRNTQAATKLNLSQSTDSLRPTYKEQGIGNLPSLLIDNTDDYLSARGILINPSYTIFSVFRVNSIHDWRFPQAIIEIYNFDGSSCLSALAEEINSSSVTGAFRTMYRPIVGASGGDSFYSTIGLKKNLDYIASEVRNVITTSDKAWINNALYFDKTLTQAGAINSRDLTIIVGNLTECAPARPLDGQISELIIYDHALKQDEVDDIEVYLSKKYGIKLN